MSRNYTYPKVNIPTESLVLCDLKHDRMDGQIAACVLQGIVNRQSCKKIYVMNTYCFDNKRGGATQVQIAERFLKELYNDLPSEKLIHDANQNWPGFMALFNRFKKFVKGLIIWDPKLEQATIEAATTIAGQTDGLVVSPAIADAIKNCDIPLIIDLRNYEFETNIECVAWLLDNWMKGANKDISFTWSHMTTDGRSWGAANKDYVVAQRLFTYYLDITKSEEEAYYKSILKYYPQGTPIMGWTDERWAEELFMHLGYFMVPYISVENMTVHSSFPSTTGKQNRPKAMQIQKNGVYISFFVADGDNLLHSMVYEPDIILSSKAYGQIPLTWVINPGLIDLAPKVFNWYMMRKGNNQEFAGMISDGHPASDCYSAFKFYCNFAKDYLERAGIVTMKQMGESEAVAWNIQPYVVNSGYDGLSISCPHGFRHKGIGPYEYHMDGETFHIGSIPLNDSAKSIRDLVRNTPVNKPLFLSVFCGTAKKDAPFLVKKVANNLKRSEHKEGRQYFFLRSMDLAATFRKLKGLSILPSTKEWVT